VKFRSSKSITYFTAILPITVSHAHDNKQQTVIQFFYKFEKGLIDEK
jgi:hypothetical protein